MHQAVLWILTGTVLCMTVSWASASTQSVTVKGRLMCGNSPARGVNVKLVDEDDGPNPDDDMASAKTGDDGSFTLSGTSSDPLGTIDPRLKVYHNCHDGITPCERKWKMHIPKKYVTDGSTSTNVMDVGTWNLELWLEEDERDCSLSRMFGLGKK